MVKTEVIENIVEESIHYPVIAELGDVVVLFTENHVGTVLESSTCSVGYYYDQWTDIKFWDILPKGVKVILENS